MKMGRGKLVLLGLLVALALVSAWLVSVQAGDVQSQGDRQTAQLEQREQQGQQVGVGMAAGMLAHDDGDADAESGNLGQSEVDEDDPAPHHMESEVDEQPWQQHECQEWPEPEFEQVHSRPPYQDRGGPERSGSRGLLERARDAVHDGVHE